MCRLCVWTWLFTASGTNMCKNFICMGVQYQYVYNLHLFLCLIQFVYELGKKSEVWDMLLTDQAKTSLTKMAKMWWFWIRPMTAYAGVLVANAQWVWHAHHSVILLTHCSSCFHNTWVGTVEWRTHLNIQYLWYISSVFPLHVPNIPVWATPLPKPSQIGCWKPCPW